MQGYFDFINYSRYAKLRSIKTPYEYLKEVKDSGYCTSGGTDKNSPTYYQYADSAYALIKQYDLFKYDSEENKVSNPYPVPTRTLYRRPLVVLSGDDVKWLQTELNFAGAKLVVDGRCGDLTIGALKNYQSTHKDVNGKQLVVDGRCGFLTKGSLLANH